MIFLLVIRSTDHATMRLLLKNPILSSCSVIFHVSPLSKVWPGQIMGGEELLAMHGHRLEKAGIDPQSKEAKHSAEGGADDCMIMWIQHYFAAEIVTKDRFVDRTMTALLFRDIDFRVEIVDARTGACELLMSTLERSDK